MSAEAQYRAVTARNGGLDTFVIMAMNINAGSSREWLVETPQLGLSHPDIQLTSLNLTIRFPAPAKGHWLSTTSSAACRSEPFQT